MTLPASVSLQGRWGDAVAGRCEAWRSRLGPRWGARQTIWGLDSDGGGDGGDYGGGSGDGGAPKN